jgi:hypothetical protein
VEQDITDFAHLAILLVSANPENIMSLIPF